MTLDNAKAWTLIIASIASPVMAAFVFLAQQTHFKAADIDRDFIQKKVEIIEKQTNHALGETKRAKAVALRLLATESKDPTHLKEAVDAEADYLEHVGKMRETEKIK